MESKLEEYKNRCMKLIEENAMLSTENELLKEEVRKLKVLVPKRRRKAIA